MFIWVFIRTEESNYFKKKTEEDDDEYIGCSLELVLGCGKKVTVWPTSTHPLLKDHHMIVTYLPRCNYIYLKKGVLFMSSYKTDLFATLWQLIFHLLWENSKVSKEMVSVWNHRSCVGGLTQLQISDAHVALQQVIHFLGGPLLKLILLAEHTERNTQVFV